MATLVDYGSSDGGESPQGSQPETSRHVETTSSILQQSYPSTTNGVLRTSHAPLSLSSHPTSEPTEDPPLGPAAPLHVYASSSPFTVDRSTIQQLTLPAHPNLSIPPSPTASPPPGLDSKISHFLSLKLQGVHFNAKLASSSALKNPSLLPKLMDSAGLDGHGGRDQYATTLPKEVWDPDTFPESAYVERLATLQQELGKRREEERRGATRDFTPGKANKEDIQVGMRTGSRGSAAERVMAGLERRSQNGERDGKRRRG